MPTKTYYPIDGYTCVSYIDASWATAHDAATGTLSGTPSSIQIQTHHHSGVFVIRRGAVAFDTGSDPIPTGANITQITLHCLLTSTNTLSSNLDCVKTDNIHNPLEDIDYGALGVDEVILDSIACPVPGSFSLIPIDNSIYDFTGTTFVGFRASFDVDDFPPGDSAVQGLIFNVTDMAVEYEDIPAVTTEAVADILATTATANGTVIALGVGDSVANEHGHCWNTIGSPTTADDHTANGVPSLGAFTSNMTLLTGGVTYYVRSYISNIYGDFYGNEVTFQYIANPIVTTQACTDIIPSAGTATANGTVMDMGTPEATNCGFVWATHHLPDVGDNVVGFGAPSLGAYTASLTGLPVGTSFIFVRAFIESVESPFYFYGEEVTIGATIIGGMSSGFIENTLQVETVLGQTISTLRGTIHDPDLTVIISEGLDIVQYDISNGEKIFAGIVSYLTDYTEGIERYFELICQSYTVLLDRSLVYASYPAGFTYSGEVGDKAILKDLFDNRVIQANGTAHGEIGASEITSDYVDTGTPGLAPLNFFYMTLRECVELLAGYAGFSYYVDYDKKLHYYYQPSATAPYGLSSSPDGSTTLQYHGLKRKRDATRIINNFIVLGTQLFGSDTEFITPTPISLIFWYVWPLGVNALLSNPVGYKYIRVFVNTGTDGAPVWTELTVGLANVDEPLIPGTPPTGYDVLWNPGDSSFNFAVAPPTMVTNGIQIIYSLSLNGGIPDSVPASITNYGRTYSMRLTASDANSAATIMTNLAHIKAQFSSGLEVITLGVDSTVFPSTTRFEIGQYVALDNAILGINKSYWIHAIRTQVTGGSVSGYQLELRNYTMA